MKSCRLKHDRQHQTRNLLIVEIMKSCRPSLCADGSAYHLLIVEIMKSCRPQIVYTHNKSSTNSRNYEVLQTIIKDGDDEESTNSRNYEVLQTLEIVTFYTTNLLIVEIMKSCRRSWREKRVQKSTNSRNYEVLQTSKTENWTYYIY